MNSFIFVAIVCIGTNCSFVTSKVPVTEVKCQEMRKQFLELPFKPEVTLVAADCATFDEVRL